MMIDRLRPMTAWMSDGKHVASFIPGTISELSNDPVVGDKYLPALIRQSKKKTATKIRKARARHMRSIGYTYIKIANALGVSITTASNDCM